MKASEHGGFERATGMRVSVVIPTLDEAALVSAAVESARTDADAEVIVVDGGSRDGTLACARAADVVLETPPGRAKQMNAGAAAASGDVLLFLHADTRLPRSYAQAVGTALARPSVVGGRFDVRLDAPGAIYALLGWLISARSRLTGVATGDQAIFVRRDVFARLGGYPELPLLEDIALCRALKRAGRFVALREKVLTSARRWQRQGLVRTIGRMWALRLLYYAGVSPARLAAMYPHAR